MTHQDRMYDLQNRQLKTQSPEGRAEHAVQAGIQRGTPEFNEFVFGIKRPDPLHELLLAPTPQHAPAALSPSPSAPGPRLMPQSFNDAPGGGDPNLVRVQSGQAPQQQQQRQEPMVTLPGGRQVPLSKAEAIQMLAAREKNQPLTDLIGQAIGKVPKSLQDDVAKKQMDSIDQVGRLEGIRQRFKPEWQTWETSLKQRGLNILDSFENLRSKIPEEERQTMVDFASFKMEAIDNLNRYIKEMTGAAMSELEAKRLRQAMPDPQNDSPTQFKSKLENSIKVAKLTHARYASIGKYGVSQYTPIEAMPDLINKRGAEIEQQIRQASPGQAQPLLDRAVKHKIKQEFGI